MWVCLSTVYVLTQPIFRAFSICSNLSKSILRHSRHDNSYSLRVSKPDESKFCLRRKPTL